MTNPIMSDQKPPKKRGLPSLRRWVQAAFLLVWAAPLALFSDKLGRWARSLPSCVFHCYYAGGGYCPAASFSCPVGIAAQFCALGVFPFLVVGVVVLAAGLVGSLICGWACPFGLIQDLLAKIPLPKLRLPAWASYGRFAVLITLVIALPYVIGLGGTPYDNQSATICRWCPAGALEAGVPSTVRGIVENRPELVMSWRKIAILAGFLVSSMVIFRPWCTVLCPLGGLLSMFNRFSLFHLKFKASACTRCNLCHSKCKYGLQPDRSPNSSRCIRCLECTTCGSLTPCASLRKPKET